jgi:hypothetical protein
VIRAPVTRIDAIRTNSAINYQYPPVSFRKKASGALVAVAASGRGGDHLETVGASRRVWNRHMFNVDIITMFVPFIGFSVATFISLRDT